MKLNSTRLTDCKRMAKYILAREQHFLQNYMCAKEDSDQTTHVCSLIWVFAAHSVGSQGFEASSSGQCRLWSALVFALSICSRVGCSVWRMLFQTLISCRVNSNIFNAICLLSFNSAWQCFERTNQWLNFLKAASAAVEWQRQTCIN